MNIIRIVLPLESFHNQYVHIFEYTYLEFEPQDQRTSMKSLAQNHLFERSSFEKVIIIHSPNATAFVGKTIRHPVYFVTSIKEVGAR